MRMDCRSEIGRQCCTLHLLILNQNLRPDAVCTPQMDSSSRDSFLKKYSGNRARIEPKGVGLILDLK